ncbi:AMP-binding protein [Nocardioides halotolerans]|uniref:AMP-binding protein n=1 Tax=Nocardioides halotolerans TaxID=433660 RepID=UPI0003FE7D25|nr:AMP-binding protein [Nocardioides halotolerans]
MDAREPLVGAERTIPGFLERQARRNGDRPAVVFHDEQVGHAQLFEEAAALAAGLAALGVRKGDHVAVLMENSVDFLRTWFGINLAGAVEVPVNTEYRRDGLAYIVGHSEARVVVVDSTLLPLLAEVRDQLSLVETLVVRQPDGTLDADQVDFSAVAATPVDLASLPAVTPGDLAAVMYTSGTTGPPKGVMLPHGCPIAWAEDTTRYLAFRPGETHYCCYPLFHTLAQYFATMPALLNDGTLALAERFSVSRFWDDVRRVGATTSNMMGSTISLLHAAAAKPDDLDNPLRRAFGAPAPPSILPDFERRFGLQFVEIYGSSEANVVLWNPLDDVRVGTCGTLGDQFDVLLVDQDDIEVEVGEVGEIATRPHRPFSMLAGYYKMPEATTSAFRNLWFHTGDLGRRDEDGYHTFVDRKKDAIRRRGENISSWEIETVVVRHPSVAECAAFGVPSALSEEDVMVVVTPVEGTLLDLEELAGFCAEQMPRYMVPRYWNLADTLPRTQTGKIEKFRLRARGVEPGTWDREAGAVRSAPAHPEPTARAAGEQDGALR